MSWHDAFLTAARSLSRRIGRAALTVLAVALAASLLSALLIISTAARTRVLNQLSKGGPLAGIQVAAASPGPQALDTDTPRPGAARDLDQPAVDRIRHIRSVRSVVPLESNPVLAEVPSTDLQPFRETLAGVDLRSISTLPVSVIVGRTPEPGSRTEVAVTEGYLRRVGLQHSTASKVIGTEVELGAPRVFPPRRGGIDVRGRWVRAEIVGVVAQQVLDAQFLGSREMVRDARAWSASSDPAGGFQLPTSRFAGLFVVADGLDHVGSVRAAITGLGYSTSAPENLIETVRRYLRVVEIVLAGIGLIALAIAALGITNALLAAVRERRQEIGVLKAIGARDRDVRRIFLIEAGITGFTGGLLGTVTGYVIARVLGAVVNQYLVDQGLRGVSIGLPATLLVSGVLGATALSVLAGIAPAQRAARLPARQALGDQGTHARSRGS